jgi:hypothetical protein
MQSKETGQSDTLFETAPEDEPVEMPDEDPELSIVVPDRAVQLPVAPASCPAWFIWLTVGSPLAAQTPR